MDTRGAVAVLVSLLVMLVVAAVLPLVAPGLIRLIDRDVLHGGRNDH